MISSSQRSLSDKTQHSQQTNKHAPGVIFYYEHTFIQAHCVHSSRYVTATVSIVPAVSVFIVQGALSRTHTTVSLNPPLSRTLYSHTSHTFPCPLTSHCTRVQGWYTLRLMYNTESHPFLPVTGQGPLVLVCFHAHAVNAPYSNVSIYIQPLPLPKHCNKSHRDAAPPRCLSCGIVVIGSQDSSQRWSGDVSLDMSSTVSVTVSRCNHAQCMLDFL